MNVDVTLLLDEQADLDSDRAALHLFAKTETLHDHVHARTAMRATRGEAHLGERLAVGNMDALRFFLRAFEPRAEANDRAIHRVCERQVNNGDRRHAFFDETDLHGEVAVAVDEAIRAVERIDHPHARLAEAAFGVD